MAAQSPYLLMGKKPVGFDEIMVPDVNPMIMMPQSNQLPTTSLNPAVVPAKQQVPTQATLNRQSSGQNPYGLSPEDMDLLKSYAEQQKINEQSIAEAEQQLLAARQAPQQLDISPLIALAQATSPEARYLGSVYRRPTDKSKEIQALQEAVLKARGQSLESSRQAIKDIRYSKLQEEQMKQAREAAAIRREEAQAAKEARSEDKGIKLQLEVGKNYDKDYGEGIAGLTEVVDAAQKARSIINEVGGIPADPSDPRTALYKRAVSSIITGYNRDVAKLGALAGADKKLLEAAASNDPNILEAYILNTVGASKGQTAVLDGLIDAADKKMKENESRVKQRFQGLANPMFETQKNIYQQARGIQSGQEGKKIYSREELLQIRQQDPAKFQQIKSELGLK